MVEMKRGHARVRAREEKIQKRERGRQGAHSKREERARME
jgi:hypothetical protein